VATASLTTVESSARRRPHRSLPHPATVYQARPEANPGTRTHTRDRVRTDRVDQAGSITLRGNGRLHHIGVGRHHHRTRVLILERAARTAGVEGVGFHTLRHSVAVGWLESGLHIKAVADLLGHSSINITGDIYGHTSDATIRVAIDGLTSILGLWTGLTMVRPTELGEQAKCPY
jgi:integrase